MDFKKIKNNFLKRLSEMSGTNILIVLLVCIIAAQCVTIAVLCHSNHKYRVMFDEALEGQLALQQEINARQNEEER